MNSFVSIDTFKVESDHSYYELQIHIRVRTDVCISIDGHYVSTPFTLAQTMHVLYKCVHAYVLPAAAAFTILQRIVHTGLYSYYYY